MLLVVSQPAVAVLVTEIVQPLGGDPCFTIMELLENDSFLSEMGEGVGHRLTELSRCWTQSRSSNLQMHKD